MRQNENRHLFATILDYCGKAGHPSQGQSLRPLIERKDDGAARIVVSEWNATRVPGFTVFDGRWKYLCGQAANAPSLDALYDLQADPLELNNLIGLNAERDKHQADAQRMRGLLVDGQDVLVEAARVSKPVNGMPFWPDQCDRRPTPLAFHSYPHVPFES